MGLWILRALVAVTIGCAIYQLLCFLKRKRSTKHKKTRKQTCTDCYLSVNTSGFVESGNVPDVLAATWNDPVLLAQCKWSPSTVVVGDNAGAITGFGAPACGDYWLEYHVGLISDGAIGLVLVNGQILARSATWTLDLEFAEEGLEFGVHGRQLAKSFMLHLNKGDVVSVIVLPFIFGNPLYLPSYPAGDNPFRYLTTLTIDLRNPKPTCKCDWQNSNEDLVAGEPIVFGSNKQIVHAAAEDGKESAPPPAGAQNSFIEAIRAAASGRNLQAVVSGARMRRFVSHG